MRKSNFTTGIGRTSPKKVRQKKALTFHLNVNLSSSTIVKDFIKSLLDPNPTRRLTAAQALDHPVRPSYLPLFYLPQSYTFFSSSGSRPTSRQPNTTSPAFANILTRAPNGAPPSPPPAPSGDSPNPGRTRAPGAMVGKAVSWIRMMTKKEEEEEKQYMKRRRTSMSRFRFPSLSGGVLLWMCQTRWLCLNTSLGSSLGRRVSLNGGTPPQPCRTCWLCPNTSLEPSMGRGELLGAGPRGDRRRRHTKRRRHPSLLLYMTSPSRWPALLMSTRKRDGRCLARLTSLVLLSAVLGVAHHHPCRLPRYHHRRGWR